MQSKTLLADKLEINNKMLSTRSNKRSGVMKIKNPKKGIRCKESKYIICTHYKQQQKEKDILRRNEITIRKENATIFGNLYACLQFKAFWKRLKLRLGNYRTPLISWITKRRWKITHSTDLHNAVQRTFKNKNLKTNKKRLELQRTKEGSYRNKDLLETFHCKYSRKHYLHKKTNNNKR